MDKLFSNLTDGIAPTLEELCPIYGRLNYSFGVTINLPRVKKFTCLQSGEQKEMLMTLFKCAVREIKCSQFFHHVHEFEFCKDGNIHLHALLYSYKSTNSDKISPRGYVQDFVKVIRRYINDMLKTNYKKNPLYSDKYIRASAPYCVVQYMNDTEEFLRWAVYCYKQYSTPKKI